MKVLYSTLREAPLNNNCPKCFSNNGLRFVFKQKALKSAWSNRRTEELKSELHCKNCEQQIFPVDWNTDIERVYEYQLKATTPKPSYYKPSRNFYLVIVLSLVVAGGIAAYFLMNQQ